MMESVGAYVFSVTAAGIISGLITAVLGEKSLYSGMIKMLVGIFLAVAVVAPLTDIRLENMDDYLSGLEHDGQTVVETGIQKSEDAISAIIKSKTEAYILDKAASLGVTLSVEVMVENGNVPQISGVQLSGQVSPYAKQQLKTIIANDLGIAKENQEWI